MARHVLKLLVGLGLWLWLTASTAVSAWSAQILVSPASETVMRITIRGDLDFNDAIVFMRKTAAVKDAIVLLQSPGGNAAAGIAIGRAIRDRGFLTIVPPSAICASACALAWLGGARRFMGEGAQIGFHAAYVMRGGRQRRSTAANAALTDYVRRLGLPRQAVSYVTGAPPERMYWLDLAAAQAVGIEAGRYTADGIINSGPQKDRAPMTIHEATDYPGNDVGRLRQTSLLDCLVACSADNSCKAFTFVTYRNECWLKNATGSAEPRGGLVSGVK